MNLKIRAFQGIEAESNGDFSYSYSTKAIPSGDFEVKVGGITKEITIQPKEISGSTSGLTSGSTSGSNSGSNSGSISGSNSGSISGSNSEYSPTKPSSVETKKTSTQSKETSDSTSVSSAVGSPSVKTGSSLEPTTSKTLEEKGVSGASNLNKNLEEKNTQKQPSGEGAQKSKSSHQFVDPFYLLAGLGAGILIFIMYSMKK